jgi:hypothetical protein
MRFKSEFNDGQRGFFGLKRFMVRPPASLLVGLITIEALAVESRPDGAMPAEREDATLQQVLIYLSGGTSRATSTSEAAAEITARRFPCAMGSRWGGTARLPANLDNLRAELQLALAQTLGRIGGDR